MHLSHVFVRSQNGLISFVMPVRTHLCGSDWTDFRVI
jgi:hypothetical protein